MMTMGKRNFMERPFDDRREVYARFATMRRNEEASMAESTGWWLAAGIAVAVELGTGTFYLLMLAIGLAAGAVAAHVGAGVAGQFAAAAVIGGGAVAALHLR